MATGSQTQINDEARWNILQRKAQEVRVARAFCLLRSNGIEPVLIKGFAAGRNYPESVIRLSIDTDLAVAAADFQRAYEIAVSSDAEGLAIDLHRELRHLDTLAWDDLFENSELFEIDGGTVRLLRPEDHLRVLCVHWLNDGGTDRGRLWDIYYAVENRPADFDWGRFLDVVSRRRRRWLICAVGLAHRFLGLDISETPINTRSPRPAGLAGKNGRKRMGKRNQANSYGGNPQRPAKVYRPVQKAPASKSDQGHHRDGRQL